MRRIVIPLSVLAAAGLVLGYLGPLHPLGDSFAVFRLHFGVAAVALTLLVWRTGRRIGIPAALAAAVATLPAVLPVALAGQGGGAAATRVYQKNLSFRLADPQPLARDIAASDADIVTLQEVTGRNAAVLDAVRSQLPTQAVCPFSGVGAVALAARWPAVPGTEICAAGQGLVAVRLDAPRGPVWAVSLHLHWPWPYRQGEQLDAILPILAGLDGPVILGGDFNMVPWGASLSRIARATGTRRVGRARPSFPRFGAVLPLPIDHVLGPSSGSTALRPRLGSDHFGILARVD